MTHSVCRYLALICAMSMAICAHAQQPPDVVQSDDGQNQDTAMGTGALASLSLADYGAGNTAAGYGALNADTSGYYNTAVGDLAMYQNVDGFQNTAVGYYSLGAFSSPGSNNTAVGANTLTYTTGSLNTAVGSGALQFSTSGSANTALGQTALNQNSTGQYNVATGFASLYNNQVGTANTATGTGSLYGNTSGNENVSSGHDSLFNNSSGSYNTASGGGALHANTSGANNTAFGYEALYSNTVGKGNAAQGVNALYGNTTGIRNLGIGSNALYANTTGSYNIALGFNAGYNVTTGSNNIELGSMGSPSDEGTIQIGVQGTQTNAKIAGIYGVPVTGSAVYVTASGQLGVQPSAERFKTDITPMPELSEKLEQLRPVAFRYKADQKGIEQYGLIAEEVDKVYPELVIRDDSGRIQGIHYEELAPMLLHEMQQQLRKQQRINRVQTAKIQHLEKQLLEMQTGLKSLQSKAEVAAH